MTGVLNVMKVLKMLPGAPEQQIEIQAIPRRLTNRHYLNCERVDSCASCGRLAQP